MKGKEELLTRRTVLKSLLLTGTSGVTGCAGFFITATTTTTLTSSATSAVYGASVTLTAKVVSASATGTVTFYDSSTELGAGTLSSGSCTYTSTLLAEGAHTLYAVYGGDTTFNSSTSASITVVVSAALTTTTTMLSASTTGTTAGMSVAFTATVSSTAATGTMHFYDGSTLLGSATLAAATGTYTTTTLASGTHNITAAYVGDSSYGASTSGAVTVVIS